MRGSTFYYVNDVLGQPFFAVEQVVDEGLLKTLRNIIIPRLLSEVPGQPSLQELEKDPRLYRFMIIFDREGYSPDFFREMWVEHRKEKSELLEEIEQFQFELGKLKAERKKHPKHIDFDELPENLQFERLKPSKRLFFDTVKMLVYRAETAMANTVRQFLDRDDARVLIRQLMKSHADIIPDTEGKILNVRIHRFTTRRHDRAIGDLLTTLNETETPYPGTDMKLVYSLTG